MKKLYLLFVFTALLTASALNAQEYISFEAEEGYDLGDINLQQGWTTTGVGGEQYTQLQVVTDQIAKVGDRSLKITQDPIASSQPFPVMGAFRTLDTPLDKSNFSIGYSINVESPPGGNSSIFALECGSIVDEMLVLEIYFSYDGKILILENADTEFIVTEIGNWVQGVWYDILVSGNEEGVSYFLNGELQYTGALLYNIDELRFAHDNYSGSAFIDDVSIDHVSVQVREITENSWQIYPNPVEDVLFLEGLADVESYAIYDITGKNLSRLNNNTKQIDVSHLTNGVYFLQINTQKGQVTKKFVKK